MCVDCYIVLCRPQDRLYLEYPGAQPDPVELPAPKPVKGPSKEEVRPLLILEYYRVNYIIQV